MTNTNAGYQVERKVYSTMRSRGRRVTHMAYLSPYDLVIDGWRVEVKGAQMRMARGAPIWTFNLHRHGKLAENCDFYVFCLLGCPYASYAIYLLYNAPMKRKVHALSFRSLLTGEGIHGLEFEKLASGELGMGPLADEQVSGRMIDFALPDVRFIEADSDIDDKEIAPLSVE